MSLSTTDQDNMELYLDFEEYKESLPFSAAESESLKKRLHAVLKNMDFHLTPEAALVLSAGFVAAPRLMPLGASYFKKDAKTK